ARVRGRARWTAGRRGDRPGAADPARTDGRRLSGRRGGRGSEGGARGGGGGRGPPGEGGRALGKQALDDLRTIVAAPNVEVTALPFSAPEIPSLYGGGLGRDVVVQPHAGRDGQ